MICHFYFIFLTAVTVSTCFGLGLDCVSTPQSLLGLGEFWSWTSLGLEHNYYLGSCNNYKR